MSPDLAPHFVWGAVLFVFLIILAVSAFRKRRDGGYHGSSLPGAGAYGAVYDMLNEDKRKAIEIIVEEKAEARDPEDADGNLPDLEQPKRANAVSEPRERSEPAKRRARERVGEFEGRSPSNKAG